MYHTMKAVRHPFRLQIAVWRGFRRIRLLRRVYTLFPLLPQSLNPWSPYSHSSQILVYPICTVDGACMKLPSRSWKVWMNACSWCSEPETLQVVWSAWMRHGGRLRQKCCLQLKHRIRYFGTGDVELASVGSLGIQDFSSLTISITIMRFLNLIFDI